MEKPIVRTLNTGPLSLSISLDFPQGLRTSITTGNRVVDSHKGATGSSRRTQIVRSKNSYPLGK